MWTSHGQVPHVTSERPLRERDPNTVAPSTSQKKGDSAEKNARTNTKTSSASSDGSKKTNKPPGAAELSDTHVPGEEEEAVQIFDTCDDIRKKINDHLKKQGVTQAGFSRELSELMPYDRVQPRQLAKFLSFKGPRAGGHNPAFYAAYVYFEKLRLKEGKKKSAKREKLEEAWKDEGGFPREGSHNMHLTCVAGESWRIDYLGQIQIQGAPTGGPINRKRARKS